MANQTLQRDIKTYFQDAAVLHAMSPPLYLSAEVTFEQAPESVLPVSHVPHSEGTEAVSSTSAAFLICI